MQYRLKKGLGRGLSSLLGDTQKKVETNFVTQKHCFFKLMTHFLVNINKDFLQKVTNVIFIRDPKEIIFSYSKVIKSPKMSDIGVKMQFDLFNYLEKSNSKAIVLDSKHLLENPSKILKKLCDMIDIHAIVTAELKHIQGAWIFL